MVFMDNRNTMLKKKNKSSYIFKIRVKAVIFWSTLKEKTSKNSQA
jgi:hypothetical protein